MLQRFFSLCRRLVGGASEAAGAGGEERRVWVRYPCVARTTVQTMSNGDQRLSARVRNVSRGGTNLVVNHRFKPGDMISVEVPTTTEEQATVLACIIHVNELTNGLWSLGCTFSEQLEEGELEAFVTRRETPTGSEKREWARHPCRVTVTYQLVADPHKQSWPASMVNISLGGIGLQVDRDVESGALLNLELENPGGEKRTILACVLHVLSRGDRERLLGCNFIQELQERDLEALMRVD